jgi:transposase
MSPLRKSTTILPVLQLTPKEVHIYLAHEDLPTWPCAECAAPSKLYDHQPERQWRHLDTCQYRTILHADPPRTQCPTHGVRVVKLPWAEPSSRFAALFEALAIAWLKAASQKAVADQLGLSWDEIHGIAASATSRTSSTRSTSTVAAWISPRRPLNSRKRLNDRHFLRAKRGEWTQQSDRLYPLSSNLLRSLEPPHSTREGHDQVQP